MNKNIINCKKGEFVPGRALRATVKVVHEMGVEVKMPGGRGSGIISSRCWGTGIAREKALAAIRPDDEFDVVVRSYDARTMTLSLVLAGCEHLVSSPLKTGKVVHQIVRPKTAGCPRKQSFVPLAADTTFLWDASNLLGAVGAEDAAQTFASIAKTMSGQRYKAMFFIERRCLTWALHNQRSAEEAAELDMFARRGDVVVVGDGGSGTGEADCAILQMAEALPGSVCVTRDRYDDYAHAFPDIVGTERVRSFSVAKVGDKTMILVNGVPHAIVVVNNQKEMAASHGTPSVEVQTPARSSQDASTDDSRSAEVPAMSVTEDVAENHRGLFAVADECVRRGDEQGAVRLYEKVAKRDPAAYRVLAEMYRGGTAVPADGKKATRYERLARAFEKRRRECSLRERRMRAEAIRGTRYFADHFAAKRRKALSMAIFVGNHENFCEYGRGRRVRRDNGAHDRRAA